MSINRCLPFATTEQTWRTLRHSAIVYFVYTTNKDIKPISYMKK